MDNDFTALICWWLKYITIYWHWLDDLTNSYFETMTPLIPQCLTDYLWLLFYLSCPVKCYQGKTEKLWINWQMALLNYCSTGKHNVVKSQRYQSAAKNRNLSILVSSWNVKHVWMHKCYQVALVEQTPPGGVEVGLIDITQVRTHIWHMMLV